MHLTGVPRIAHADEGQIYLSVETFVRDLICDVARAMVDAHDDVAFNAMDDVGMTLEAMSDTEVSDTGVTLQALSERLHDQLDVAIRELGVSTAIVMRPQIALALADALTAQALAGLEAVGAPTH